jgi:hypothetical protein
LDCHVPFKEELPSGFGLHAESMCSYSQDRDLSAVALLGIPLRGGKRWSSIPDPFSV